MERTADPASGETMSLLDLLALLWRRRLLLLGMALLGLGSAVGVLAWLPKIYVAEALILIEPRPDLDAEGLAVPGVLDRDSVTIDSQVEVLASRSLASRVIAELGLEDSPELRPKADFWSRLLTRLSTGSGTTAAVPLASGTVVDAFLSRLRVERQGKTRVIAVRYAGEDPQLAARIANALAETYVVGLLEAKFETAKRATSWLNERLRSLEARLRGAERELAAFRAEAPSDLRTPLAAAPDRLADLERQRIMATAERKALEARYRQLREAVAQGRADAVLAAGQATPLLQDLQRLKARLIRREAELLGLYGEKHPAIVDLRREKAGIERQIARERADMLAAFEARLRQARAKERSLESELVRIKEAAGVYRAAETRKRELEREVELARSLYESFASKLRTVSDREEMAQPDARVISEAVAPRLPASPDPRIVLSLAFGGFLGLGLTLVYFLERLDRGFRTLTELGRHLGVPALTAVPRLRSRQVGDGVPADLVLDRPHSRFAEAMREILAALALGGAGRGETLLVTSTLPEEGKTTLALSLARLAAYEGMRVLLIDADLRRPRLHEMVGLEVSAGLADFLEGDLPLAEVLARDPASEVFLLPGSPRRGRPARLLGRKGIENLLAAARENYDLVILDSAPLAVVADTALLTPYADHVLFAVRWRRTGRAVAAQGLARLGDARERLLGAVLTRVDLLEQARYGEADGLLAKRRLADYYAD